MNQDTAKQIDYKQIVAATLIKVVIMFSVIFLMNTFPLIKQSFTAEIPPLNSWLNHSIKLSNIILIIGFGGYFFYASLTKARESIRKNDQS